MTRGWTLVVVLMAAAMAACEKDASTTAPTNCSSGSDWSGGHGQTMAPGQACGQCHGFAVAGTVMGATNDDDNCNGVSGVTVEITDAAGAKHTYTTNSAGNFLADEHNGGTISMPYTARVIGPTGKVVAMGAAQSDGDCNSCHGAVGSNGAPGRIVAPL